MTDLTERLRELLANATPGPWMVQDGCSWRRIGTRQHDGDVLRPTNSRTDGHPDLTADDGMCRYNLEAIVETHNALPDLLTTLETLTQENARLREAGWRDIESAPRDGTEMDLWCDIEGYRPGRVTNCVWMHGPSGPDWYTRGERGWEPIGAIGVTPTHWMPLPPAPARKALGGGDEK